MLVGHPGWASSTTIWVPAVAPHAHYAAPPCKNIAHRVVLLDIISLSQHVLLLGAQAVPHRWRGHL